MYSFIDRALNAARQDMSEKAWSVRVLTTNYQSVY